MATFEETQAAIAAMEAQNAANAPGDGSGALARFGSGLQRGVLTSPADVMSLQELARGGDGSQSQDMQSALERFSGRPEPETFAGKVGQRIGRSAPFLAAGTAASAIGGAGARALLSEVAADVVGGFAGQAAEESGAGFAGQFGAEMAASVAIPGMFAKNIAEAANDPRKVAALAKQYKIKEEDVLRAGHFLRNKYPVDPNAQNPDRFVDIGEENLAETRRLFPDQNVRPSLRQALGEDAGAEFAALEERLASDPNSTFGRRLAGRKLAVRLDLEQQFDELLPEGNFGQVSSGFNDIKSQMVTKTQEAWAAVDFDEIPKIPTARLKLAAKEARKRAAGISGRVPAEASVIDDLPDVITPDQLQALRSNALLTDRIARRGGEMAQGQAPNLDPIVKALNRELDELPASGSKAYKKALRTTREMHQTFDSRSVSVALLEDQTQGRKVVSGIRESKDPKREVEKALRILDQTPNGSDAFRRAVIEEAFDDSVDALTPRSVKRKMRQKKDFYMAALGADRYRKTVDILDAATIARRGRAATPAAVSSVGSGIPRTPAEMLWSGIELAEAPMQGTARGIRTIWKKVSGVAKTEPERMAIVQEALLDIEFSDVLMRLPKRGQEDVWSSKFDKLVARARARKQLAVRAAYRSGRNEIESENTEPQRQR